MRLKAYSLLSRYIAKQFILSFLLFLAIFTAIIELFELIEMLRRTADHPNVTFFMSLGLTLLKAPLTVQEVFPFLILFATMQCLWKLTKSQELIIIRASGVSIWQFLSPVIYCGALIGIFQFAVFNPMSAAFIHKYEILESKYLNKQRNVFGIEGSGLWLRQNEDYGSALIHAQKVSKGLSNLQKVTIIMQNNDDTGTPSIYAGRIDAERASLENGNWILSNVWVNLPSQDPQFKKTYLIKTDVSASQIEESFSTPNTISFWHLPKFIQNLDATGFPTIKHKMHFLSLLFTPILYIAMILLAATFSLRQTRKGGALIMVSSGLVTGLGLYILKNITFALGASETLPTLLAASAPALAALFLGIGALIHLEDAS